MFWVVLCILPLGVLSIFTNLIGWTPAIVIGAVLSLIILLLRKYEQYAVRKLAHAYYDLIYKYDLWFYFGVDQGREQSLKLPEWVIAPPSGYIPHHKSLLERIWWMSERRDYAQIMGEYASSYAAKEKNNSLIYPANPTFVIGTIWSIPYSHVTFEVISNLFIILTCIVLYFFYGFMFLYFLIFAAAGIFELAAINRLSAISSAAAYYKMLTDNWPWEIANENGKKVSVRT